MANGVFLTVCCFLGLAGVVHDTTLRRAEPRAGGSDAMRRLTGRCAAVACGLAGIAACVLAPGAALPATGATSPGAPAVPVGTVPSQPAGTTWTGSIAAQTPMQLSVMLRSRDPRGLEALAQAVATPGSPAFRHFLSPAEVQAQFGPSPALVAGLAAWFTSRGLSVGPAGADGLVLPVEGPASAVTAALRTRFASFRQRSGRITFANTTAPALPSDLAAGVATVAGLDDTLQAQPHPVQTLPRALHRAQASGATPASPAAGTQAVAPCAAASTAAGASGGYTANRLADTYGFDSAYGRGDQGQGTTVALFELAGYSQANIKAFEKCYGIGTAVKPVRVSGGARVSGGSIEVELDIEDVISLAPSTSVLVYEAPNTAAGLLADYGAIAQADTAQVVSTSWGVCEPLSGGITASEDTIFQEMAVQGQTMLAAAGDSGSADCLGVDRSTALSVDDPASQPWVTGVGGTDLTSAGTTPKETAWNDSSGGGGGGISSKWSMPSWQAVPGVVTGLSSGAPCQAAGTVCREVPDVSASASPFNGYVVFCTSGSQCPHITSRGWFTVGGTSAAAPLWAALVALADSSASGRAGFVNPVLYKNASTPGAFNDVTTGNNDFAGTNGGLYPATVGYDMATGLGTPGGAVLIPLLG